MATWKRLEEYAPFVRPLVAHMWEARPPLSPSQFAAAAGLRRQLLSTWLNSPADAVISPEPRALVRLARALGRPVAELFARAGHADADDPLMDRAGAWDCVLAAVAAAPAAALAPGEREGLLRALGALRERAAGPPERGGVAPQSGEEGVRAGEEPAGPPGRAMAAGSAVAAAPPTAGGHEGADGVAPDRG